MATTPNMNMALPDPGDSGPTWAEKLNEALDGVVDGHDHTFGRGVPVPVAGLSIDAELPMNGHDLAGARMARFDNQTGTLAGLNDRRGLYVVAGDLYYNNGSGTAVRVTDGAGLSGASLGNITNLPSVAYPNASLSWLDSFPGFALYQNTNVFARLRSGEIEVHESGAVSPNAVTIKSPASLAADYALTLPPAKPAADAFLTMNASGAMGTQARAGGIGTTDLAALAVTTAKIADGNVTTAKIADGAVTDAKVADWLSQGKIAATTLIESATCTFFTTTSTSWTDVTNLSVAINNVVGGLARPVRAQIVATDQDSYVLHNAGSSPGNLRFRFAVPGGVQHAGLISGVAGESTNFLCGAIATVFNPGAVAGAVKLQVQLVGSGGGFIEMHHVKLVVQVLI